MANNDNDDGFVYGDKSGSAYHNNQRDMGNNDAEMTAEIRISTRMFIRAPLSEFDVCRFPG